MFLLDNRDSHGHISGRLCRSSVLPYRFHFLRILWARKNHRHHGRKSNSIYNAIYAMAHDRYLLSLCYFAYGGCSRRTQIPPTQPNTSNKYFEHVHSDWTEGLSAKLICAKKCEHRPKLGKHSCVDSLPYARAWHLVRVTLSHPRRFTWMSSLTTMLAYIVINSYYKAICSRS